MTFFLQSFSGHFPPTRVVFQLSGYGTVPPPLCTKSFFSSNPRLYRFCPVDWPFNPPAVTPLFSRPFLRFHFESRQSGSAILFPKHSCFPNRPDRGFRVLSSFCTFTITHTSRSPPTLRIPIPPHFGYHRLRITLPLPLLPRLLHPLACIPSFLWYFPPLFPSRDNRPGAPFLSEKILIKGWIFQAPSPCWSFLSSFYCLASSPFLSSILLPPPPVDSLFEGIGLDPDPFSSTISLKSTPFLSLMVFVLSSTHFPINLPPPSS